jgi:hypothetical protein
VPALGDPGRLSPLSRRFSRERVSSLDARLPVSPKPRPGRKRADQASLIDFCNRREGRAHPGATRLPARLRDSRGRSAIEGRGRQAPVTRLGVELPRCRSLRPDQACPRRTSACSARKRAPLSGSGLATTPERVRPTHCPKARLRPAARTVRPSNEPGYLRAAQNRGFRRGPSLTPSESNEGVHFSRTRRQALDGADHRVRGRETVSVAQQCDQNDLPAASERRSAKRVAREQMCRELRVHSTRRESSRSSQKQV